jgi:DeoR/GlpR family transcriptional regulator of sugar metabolism
MSPESLSAATNKRAVRQRALAELVTKQGSLSAQELANELSVSIMTVHRDIEDLERQGVVRKFRGGVSAQPSVVFESNVDFRLETNPTQKRSLAKAAIKFVEPGMTIVLDNSTTVLQMVPLLREVTPIYVATNFLKAINQLSVIPDIRLVTFGGDFDPTSDTFTGVLTEQAIESIRVDAGFFSASAVSGTSAYQRQSRIVAFKQAMMKAANAKYLLLDHTKLDKVAFHKLAPLNQFDLVFISEGASEDSLEELTRAGVKFEVVPD